MGNYMSSKRVNHRGDIAVIFSRVAYFYRKDKWFILLRIFDVLLAVTASFMAAYLPAALVRDLENDAVFLIFIRDISLISLGLLAAGVLAKLNACAEDRMAESLSCGEREKLIDMVLHAGYDRIENKDFQSSFYNSLAMLDARDVLITGTAKSISDFAGALAGMLIFLFMMHGLPLIILLVIVIGTIASFGVGIACNRWEERNRHIWWNIDTKTAYISRHCADFSTAKDVAMYDMVPWFKHNYETELHKRLKITLRMQLNYWLESGMWSLSRLIWEGLAYFLLIRGILSGSMEVYRFTLYTGMLTGFAGWCRQMGDSFKGLNSLASKIRDQEDLEISLEKGSKANIENGVNPAQASLTKPPLIEFKNVSFSYPGSEKPGLHDLSLKIIPGEKIAVVGENGAGKTPFIELLCGFYKPQSGQILINDRDISEYGDASALFTGVFQDKSFFPISVAENVSLKKDTDAKKLDEVLKEVGIYERIKTLPKGKESNYFPDTEEGIELSGGEEQKLLLARALYKDSQVLLLDEPTSALDPLVESQLYSEFNTIAGGKTCIFISHRLASTRFCDRIILFGDGKVKELGSHEELIKLGGTYAEMFRVQSRYYKDGETA